MILIREVADAPVIMGISKPAGLKSPGISKPAGLKSPCGGGEIYKSIIRWH